MGRARWIAAVALCLAAMACGSRSELVVGATPGAGGASSGGGASGTGGTPPSGGTGGAPACLGLVQKEPIVEMPPPPGPVVYDDYLRLVATSGQGEVSAVFDRGVSSGIATLMHAPFFPWTAWPTTGAVAPVFSTGVTVLDAHQVAPAPGGGYAFLALLAGGVALIGSVDPHADGPGEASAIHLDGADAEILAARPAALGEPAFFAGTFSVTAGMQSILGRVVGTNGPIGESATLACGATQAPTGAAVPFDDGWLVAVSSASPLGSCSLDAPTQIEVLFVDATGHATTVTAIDAGGTVVNVRAAPHPEGLYVVWRAGSVGPTLDAARIDVVHQAVVGPVAISTDPYAGNFAIASLASKLVVAYRATPDLRISLRDESLAETVLAVTGIVPAAITSELASPDGRSLLVGYTTLAPGSYRVRIARFDCTP